MLKPFFPFYGSKWRDAKRYAGPLTELVVEPFAGSAGYSTFYEPQQVLLNDADPIICGVWDYLIKASVQEILKLPDLEVGQSVDSLDLPQEARWLIGFWLNRGSAQPKKTRTAYSARTDKAQLIWGERARQRIASQVDFIRHWKITQGEYSACPDTKATWFVDPPYQDKGRYYRFSKMDYPALAEWVKILNGWVMVCEQEGASWLPFEPMAIIKSSRGVSSEVVYKQSPRLKKVI